MRTVLMDYSLRAGHISALNYNSELSHKYVIYVAYTYCVRLLSVLFSEPSPSLSRYIFINLICKIIC